ncbi:MAG: FHA domain-containing protein, partial [Deltaproteobacteria bacterium]
MIQITIAEKGGQPRRLQFDKPEVFIGRVDQNDIVLPKGNVSKQHSKLVLREGRIVVVDLKSTNGTFVNGKKIAAPQVVRADDKINIGDFVLGVEPGRPVAKGVPSRAPTRPPPEPEPDPDEASGEDRGLDEDQLADAEEPAAEAEAVEDEPPPEPEPLPPPPPQKRPAVAAARAAEAPKGAPKPLPRRALPPKSSLSPEILALAKLQKEIHDRLLEYLDLRRLDIDKLGDEELWNKTEK